MSKLEKIKAKVAAILRKTTANGATESEAMAAIEIAGRMMTEHGITLADIRDNTEAAIDFIARQANENKYVHAVDQLVCPAIARYTDTKVWNDKREKRTSKVMFFGYSVDVELAIYIRSVCYDAMEAEWDRYKITIPKEISKISQRKSFLSGMSFRLRQRLDELKKESVTKTNGNELVVVKTELVSRAFNEQVKGLKKSGTVKYTANNAFHAGKAAAENVRFHRQVYDGPQGGVKMIGKR
jgi:hypothetical protein